VETLADLFSQLNERELRRIGSAVSSRDEIVRTVERYDDEALLVILEAATQEDSMVMIRHMDAERGNGLLRRLDEARAHALLKALSALEVPAASQSKMRNILRMRRLFA
jgi:Mg/Co/Ni transporter MgtE